MTCGSANQHLTHFAIGENHFVAIVLVVGGMDDAAVGFGKRKTNRAVAWLIKQVSHMGHRRCFAQSITLDDKCSGKSANSRPTDSSSGAPPEITQRRPSIMGLPLTESFIHRHEHRRDRMEDTLACGLQKVESPGEC